MKPVFVLLASASLAVAAMPDADIEQLDFGELLATDVEVYSASKKRQPVAEAPSIISVVTRDQILHHGYRSVAEALASVPGLYISTDHVFHDIGVRGVSGEVRGRSRLLKVMINGRPTSMGHDSTNLIGPELVPIHAVERIEVIRGPESALYGANAYLGVVNVITRKGGQIDGGEIGTTGHLADPAPGPGFDAWAVAGWKLGPLDLMAAAEHTRADRGGLELPCTTFPEADDPCAAQRTFSKDPSIYDHASFDDVQTTTSLIATAEVALDFLSTAAKDGELGHLSLQGGFRSLDSTGSFSDWGMLNHAHIDGEELEGSGNRIAVAAADASLRYRVSLLEGRLELELGGGIAGGGPAEDERLLDERGFEGTAAEYEAELEAGRFEERQDTGFGTHDADAEIRLGLLRDAWRIGERSVLGDVDLLLGIGIERASVDLVRDGAAQPKRIRRAELTSHGGHAQLTATWLGGRVGTIGGVRHDRHNGQRLDEAEIGQLTETERYRLCEGAPCYSHTSYRAGITARLVEDLPWGERPFLDSLYLKVLWGTAFKAPAPVFLYDHGFLGPRPVNPNPVLRPQTVSSFEAMLGARLLEERVELSVTWFRNQVNDRAAFTTAGQGVVAHNDSSVESVGVEAELRARVAFFEIYANAMFQDSEKSFDDDRGQIRDTFGFPEITAHLGLTTAIAPAWLVVTTDLQYVGARVGSFLNRGGDREGNHYELEPYLLLHLSLTTRGLELLGERESRFGLGARNVLNTQYALPGFQPYYRTDLPGEPRSVYLTIEQSF